MLEFQLSEGDDKLYSKLYVSRRDIAFSQYCAGVLLKKGWHAQPWERRGTIYNQQAAFTSALITAYARPFTRSRGWPTIPPDLIDHTDQEATLHRWLIKMRHTVYAHSDSANYSIRRWRSGGFETDIEHVPTLRVSAEDVALFQVMANKQCAAFSIKMAALLAAASSQPVDKSKNKRSKHSPLRVPPLGPDSKR